MNLAELWNYMQLDLEADKFKSDMAQSEKRGKLMKLTDFLKEQQGANAKIEAHIDASGERVEELEKEAERLNKLLEDLTKEIGEIANLDDAQVAEKLESAQKLLERIEECEKEIVRIRKECESDEHRMKEVRVRAAKAKAEYTALKSEYDVEFANDKIKLKQLRDKADKAASELDPADYERYKQVKQHATPPISRLVNNQCTGCFMTLPQATLRELRNSDTVHTCDNCGRLLFVTD